MIRVNQTEFTVAILETMNQDQLLELFCEVKPLAQLAMIAQSAIHTYESRLFANEDIEEIEQEISELDDWRNQDNDERARDIRISNERPY